MGDEEERLLYLFEVFFQLEDHFSQSVESVLKGLCHLTLNLEVFGQLVQSLPDDQEVSV